MIFSIEKTAETYHDVAKDLNLSICEVKGDSIKLLNDVQVDDGITGGSKREVDRMIRVKFADSSISETIPSMMKKVSLKLKTIILHTL